MNRDVEVEAKNALMSMMPKKEDYAGIQEDLISFLQKRDFKWKYAFNQELLDDLAESLLPTKLLPLTKEEGNSLRELYTFVLIKEKKQDERSESAIENDAIIQNLAIRLEKVMNQTCAEYQVDGVFLKLSFMSPKDVALKVDSQLTQLHFKEKIKSQIAEDKNLFRLNFEHYVNQQELVGERGTRDFLSLLYRLFLDSLYASLKEKDALSGLKTISQSYRCYEELNEAVVGPDHLFKVNIVIRPWVNIRPGFEFRCFVSNGVLTCASQYESVFYPQVWEKREWLQSNISSFVKEKVIPKLVHRLPSFVVDVVMTEEEKFYVCELNPFAASSSACCFNWTQDKSLIMVGPETWRFVSQEKSTNSFLPEAWVEWLRREYATEKNVGDDISINFYPLLVLGIVLGLFAYDYIGRKK